MEAVENTLVEGKILWLAQTILEGIFSGKHDEWIRLVGLGDGMEQLKSEIERVETVVAGVKGRATGNKPLARTLARLRKLMYDADDLVDELDYFRLQELVKGGSTVCANESEGTDGGGAEQVEGSRDNPHIRTSKRRKNWCKEWDHFTEIRAHGKRQGAQCKYCPDVIIQCAGPTGTRGLVKHFNSTKCKSNRPADGHQLQDPTSSTNAATNDTTDATRESFREKRMRVDEPSTNNAASTTRSWDKAKLSNRIRQIVSELKGLRGVVCDFLKDSASCSVQSERNNSDTRTTTSSSVPRKVHGRDVQKDNTIRVITAAESDDIAVLPIVGIVGVGKTAVAQLVYNDPIVRSQFERIWVWVSDMFDKVRLTREMLDVVSLESHDESHQGICNYSKLQENLKKHMGLLSKRFLLVLDDVTECMDKRQWNELLSPLKSNHKKGNVIIITTRNLSVARKLGTVEPTKLVALENDPFLLLFEACVFGDGNYEGHPSLKIIGRQIAAKLKGNPLAAETTGELLKEHLTIDHWSKILKSEEWKSMRLKTGIIHALKLSYDKLPYHLQQCFLYCSIFPEDYKVRAEDLVSTWISQGFVKCISSSKTPEQVGRDYLNDLVNLCFFEQVDSKESTFSQETEEPNPHNGPCYVMCAIVHEFARMVSGTEFATICGLECNKMLPTIRHLLILTDSTDHKDEHGSILRNKKFEEKMQSIVPHLRSLILIGSYKSFFFQSFQDIFRKARNLRLLQISATQADFHTFLCNSVNPIHLRYLKFENNGRAEALPIPLSKFYHLEVLNAEHPTIVHGLNDLISMRHLFVTRGECSSVPSVGEMSNSQEMQNTIDQNPSLFDITQLQSMNKLVQLGVYHLENVTRAEAHGAKLRDKQQLEMLLLSWRDTISQVGYCSDSESEEKSPTNDGSNQDFERSSDSEEAEGSSPIDGTSYQPLIDAETERERSQMNGTNNSLRSGPFIDMAHDILEVLEPHQNLKHLQIFGYSGVTKPDWLSTSVTFLQTLHLEDCGEWKILPSLERLPFLTKLVLRNMQSVIEVSLPSLEELVLIKMPKLERCYCNSVRDLNSSIRVLIIGGCRVLKEFPLFESRAERIIEHTLWLSGLGELTIHDCPKLTISHTLPPSSSVCRLYIARVSTLPVMKGSTNGELKIMGHCGSDIDSRSPDKPTKLDGKFLSFHHLRALTSLRLENCLDLLSPDVLPEHACEDMADANFYALPSLKHLKISNCGITGKWLSVMLRHAPALEELDFSCCYQISGLLMGETESRSLNHTPTPRASSASNPTLEGFLRIPSNLIPSLKKIIINYCNELTFQGDKYGFSGFTSLEELTIRGCPNLIQSLVHKYENNDQRNGRWLLPHSLVQLDIDNSPEALQPCFLEDGNSLKKLKIDGSPSLESLHLRSCAALEELGINGCGSLAALEGNFTCLKELELCGNSRLESLQLCTCTALEVLTIKFCALATLEGNFTCLRKLELQKNPRLKSLRLRSCTTLEKLTIDDCESLDALEDLGSLRGLRYLRVFHRPGLSHYLGRLSSQRRYELCTGLERLRTDEYSFLTTSFCKCLTSLQRLVFINLEGEVTRLTDEQDSALQRLTSLQELRFEYCRNLADLPVGLHSLPSLRRLEIILCWNITRLPEKGLPPSLEELEVDSARGTKLSDECRMQATTRSKPRVKLNGRYVN